VLRSGFGTSKSGPVAQLGARLNGIQEVTGSIPVRSTNLSNVIGCIPLPSAGVSFRYFSQGYSGVIRLGSASAAVGSIPPRLDAHS
jgi:hypothetical protein